MVAATTADHLLNYEVAEQSFLEKFLSPEGADGILRLVLTVSSTFVIPTRRSAFQVYIEKPRRLFM